MMKKKKIINLVSIVFFVVVLLIVVWQSNNIVNKSSAAFDDSFDELMSDDEKMILYARTNDLDKLKLLVDKGNNINLINIDNGMTLLHYAINERDNISDENNLQDNDKYAVAKYLIEKGINTNVADIHGNTPLMLSVYNGAEDVYKMLIDKKYINDCDEAGNSLLNLAAYSGNINIYNDLYQKGCKIDKKNKKGYSSMYYARNVKMFNNIIDKMQIKNIGSNTYKKLFLNAMSAEMVKYFVSEKNITINSIDDLGHNAIYYAYNNGIYDVADELVKIGIDVNYQDKDGMTILMYCAQDDNYEYAKLLLDNNADISILSNDGKTVEQIAKESGSAQILELLGGE